MVPTMNMERAWPALETEPDRRQRGVPVIGIVVALLLIIGGQNLLLWRFLGFASPLLLLAGAAALAGLAALVLRSARAGAMQARVSGRAIALAIAAATLLFLLGGEGRFLYANADWQIRDAVIRDIAGNAWPFIYPLADGARILRAPLAMYLLPGLAGKLFGQEGGDLFLLAQNGILLGLMLAACAPLFPNGRARLAALATFFAFGGLQIVGTLIVQAAGAKVSFGHIENWSGIQYSSVVTLAFWVPHHALAGWLCAALYALWRGRLIPLGAFLAAIPLVALWSPLAIMGAVPFALLAGIQALWLRTVRTIDLAAPAVALAVAAPALVYLSAGSETVGARFVTVMPFAWALTLLLGVAAFAAPAAAGGFRGRFAGATLLLVVASLMLMPFYRVGSSTDFEMRASIMPMAMLAFLVADMVAVPGAVSRGRCSRWRRSPARPRSAGRSCSRRRRRPAAA